MESYIEITFIHNLLVCLIAYYGSAYLSFSKIKIRYFIFFLCIELLLVVSCFEALYRSLFYLYELAMYFILFNHQYKRLFVYLSIKYTLSFTFFKFFSGSFHLLHYFVPIAINPIGSWILMGFVIYALRQKWCAYLKVSDFIYPIEIHANQNFKVKGFLDTGNSLVWNDKPVLFLDQQYADKIVNEGKQEQVILYTLNKKETIVVYEADVKVNRYKLQSCYIHCGKNVNLEWGCVCLLNMEM